MITDPDLLELIERMVWLMNATNSPALTVSLWCTDDPINCNVVRGPMLRVEKIGDNLYRVIEFYSHTATDCPDCSPEEIEQLDKESEVELGVFKIENSKIVWIR